MVLKTLNLNSNNIYNIADTKTKSMVNTYIEELKEKRVLTGYFGMLANNIYKRTRVKNSEILELLIYGSYIEEQSKLDKYEEQIMYEDTNYYYQEGQKEVLNIQKKKKPISILDMALFLALMDIPNSKGYIWKQYTEAVVKYNADQIYRQTIINIQQNKEKDIYNDMYQNIIKKQQNVRLCINDNKISGAVDNQLIGINNLAKIEGISTFDSKAECRFISVHDEKRTKMCESLDGQRFYIHDWNEFKRYSETNKGIVKYRCYGLVVGLNCPPISNNFHCCRSYIVYLPSELAEDADYELIDNIKSAIFGIKKIRENKNDLIRNAIKNQTMRSIALNDAVHNIYYYKDHKCKHKKGNIYLSKDWYKRSKEKQEKTLRHEIGHAVDYKYKYISTKKLTKALEKDKTRILNNQYKINNELKEKYYKYTELSDIIGGMTNNKVVGYGFHDIDYWKKKGKLEKETFADLFSIEGSNDIEYLQVLEGYLPNTLKEFDNIIRKLM